MLPLDAYNNAHNSTDVEAWVLLAPTTQTYAIRLDQCVAIENQEGCLPVTFAVVNRQHSKCRVTRVSYRQILTVPVRLYPLCTIAAVRANQKHETVLTNTVDHGTRNKKMDIVL